MRALLAVFAIVVIIIAAVLLIFDRDPDTEQQQEDQINLVEYSGSAAKAIYEMEGQLNAEEQHRTIRISVNRNLRRIEVLSGYNFAVERSQDFSNTQSAYDEFLHALEKAGFDQSKETPHEDERGVCPLGQRYIYELQEFGDRLIRSWSTSCNRTEGSFAGNANLVRQLFQKQIPNYREFTRDVRLTGN